MDKKQIQFTHNGEEVTATVWGLNYGFETDIQEYSIEIEVDSRNRKKAKMKPSTMRLYTTAGGVFGCEKIGIPELTEHQIEMGLNEVDWQNRVKKIRVLPGKISTILYDEIQKIRGVENTDEEEELAKK